MVVIKREMSLVERSSVGGGNFWGLVQQRGPWKTTRVDIQNSKESMKQDKVAGGGVGEGGTLHGGHGNYKEVVNPYAVNGKQSTPAPSKIALRSVVFVESNHYRKKSIAGFLPIYDPVGEKSASSVGGQKAGGSGAVATPLETSPDTTGVEEEMMTADLPSASFLTEHRMEESNQKEEEGIRALPTHPLESKGVIRKPKQKVKMNSFERVLPKEKQKTNVEKVRELMAKREESKKEAKETKTITTVIKPVKRKTETGVQGPKKKANLKDVPVFNPLKRKAEVESEKPRKKVVPKLKIKTTGLPPPVQRFQAFAGQKEVDSLAKKSDKLPKVKKEPTKKVGKKKATK